MLSLVLRAAQVWVQRQAAATSALAELLRAQGVGNVTASQVEAVAAELGVPASYFDEQKADVYETVLADVLVEAELRIPEVGDLQALRSVLGLSGPQAGARHVSRGQAIAQEAGDEVAERSGSEWARLKKLIFLTVTTLPKRPAEGRAVAEGDETPEALRRLRPLLERLQERTTVRSLAGRRVRQVLSADRIEAAEFGTSAEALEGICDLFELSAEEGRALASQAAIPFYRRAVEAAVSRLGPGTADSLERVRGALTLDLSDVADVHSAAYGRVVDECLASGKLGKDDLPTLDLVADACVRCSPARGAASRALTRAQPLAVPSAHSTRALGPPRQAAAAPEGDGANSPRAHQAPVREQRAGDARQGAGGPRRPAPAPLGLARQAPAGAEPRQRGRRGRPRRGALDHDEALVQRPQPRGRRARGL